jgi:hypothetical protein
MCPACAATIALIVAGATSVGGVTALLVKKWRPDGDALMGVKHPDSPQVNGEEHESSEDRGS